MLSLEGFPRLLDYQNVFGIHIEVMQRSSGASRSLRCRGAIGVSRLYGAAAGEVGSVGTDSTSATVGLVGALAAIFVKRKIRTQGKKGNG